MGITETMIPISVSLADGDENVSRIKHSSCCPRCDGSRIFHLNVLHFNVIFYHEFSILFLPIICLCSLLLNLDDGVTNLATAGFENSSD